MPAAIRTISLKLGADWSFFKTGFPKRFFTKLEGFGTIFVLLKEIQYNFKFVLKKTLEILKDFL